MRTIIGSYDIAPIVETERFRPTTKSSAKPSHLFENTASGRPNGAGPKHCSRPPFDHTNAPNRRVVVEPGKASRIEEDGEVRGFAVVHGDEPARLWILKLGFRYEGTMWSYGPDGKTHDMYARVVD